jgi:hypothetical protein
MTDRRQYPALLSHHGSWSYNNNAESYVSHKGKALLLSQSQSMCPSRRDCP